jgi:RNA polymerase sigma factor (sigma-70 family)
MEHGRRAEFIEAAVEGFETPLVRYATHITGDPERARDVVQETFLRLCTQNIDSLRDRLAPWLYTVCRNLALDTARKEARMKPIVDTDAGAAVGTDPSPTAVMEKKERVGKVLEVIASLPSNQQEAIRLKFQQGLRYRQIAEVMGTTVSNVGVLIHTGLNTARGRLAPLQAGVGKGGTV